MCPGAQALALCEGLRGLGLAWRCILYPRPVDEPLVRAMAGSGCVEAQHRLRERVQDHPEGHEQALHPRGHAEGRGAPGRPRHPQHGLPAPGRARGRPARPPLTAWPSPGPWAWTACSVTVGIRIYPDTPLALRAQRDGLIAPGDDLLEPRFYLAPGLEPWIHEAIAQAGC